MSKIDQGPRRGPQGSSAKDSIAATAAAAVGTLLSDDERLDEGLEETFPASDPVAVERIT